MQESGSRSSASNGRMSTSRRHKPTSNHQKTSQQQQQQHPPSTKGTTNPGSQGGGGGGSGSGRRGHAASQSTCPAASTAPSGASNASAHGGANANTQDGTDDLSTMGDGIKNQRMKQDVEDWVKSIGLDPQTPVAVVGFFGRSRDMSTVERIRRVYPSKHNLETSSRVQQDNASSRAENKFPLGVGDSKAVGDIQLYVDTTTNTLLLHHDFACNDTDMLARLLPASMDIFTSPSGSKRQQERQQEQHQEQQQEQQQQQQQQQSQHLLDPSLRWMKWMHRQEFAGHRALLFLFLVSHVVVWTLPDMVVDMKTVSVLTVLAQLKRHMMHDLDKFMAICWERLGFRPPPPGFYPPPQQSQQHFSPHNPPHHHHHHHHHHNYYHHQYHSSHHQNTRQQAGPVLPGTFVPTLLFVVERLQLSDPWYDGSSNEDAIRQGLKALLKSSADTFQSRVQCVFKASHLIPVLEQHGVPPDTRQLFVLPNAAESSFTHIIPYFSVHFKMHDVQDDKALTTAGTTTIQSQWRVPRQEEEVRHISPHDKSGNSKEPPSSAASASVDVLKADIPALRGLSRENSRLNHAQQGSSRDESEIGGPAFAIAAGLSSPPSLLDMYSALVAETSDPLLVPMATDPEMERSRSSNREPFRYPNREMTVPSAGNGEEDTTMAGARTRVQLTLASLYHEHSSVRLKRFINDRIKHLQTSLASSAGHGRSTASKRGASGTVVLPPMKQWVAGIFALREALGIAPPLRSHLGQKQNSTLIGQQQQQQSAEAQEEEGEEDDDEEEDDGVSTTAGETGGGAGPSAGSSGATDQGQEPALASSATASDVTAPTPAPPTGRSGRSRRGGANRRGGKKLATKTVNLVQKRIYDFVKVDEVMHELYGDRSEQAMLSRGAHSERYHQLKADQAKKLFQTLAHRR
ncbi:hypothetical protein BGW42_005676 [Actinomortierella wolfii]|nr:hypothetical protein BGW42_005676 [Actinomortierella wolfii]